MNRRFYFVMISILVVAFLLIAATPMVEEKPMVLFSATETCKETFAGESKTTEGTKTAWGTEWVCQDLSRDPLANGTVELKLLWAENNTRQKMAGYAWYWFTFTNDKGTWMGYRIARTNNKGTTFTNGWGWGTKAMGDRPNLNGVQLWTRMTDASPNVITGKYLE